MKGRFIGIIATPIAALALSAGILSLPAAAATSGISTVVFDGATNAAWTNDPSTEVTGATAFDTATVTGDGTQTPAGSVTYTFFDNGTCTTDANTTSDTEPVTGGLAQNSSTQGPLAAGSYSFQAVYNGDLGVGGDNDPSGPSDCEPFTVSQATPTAPTITNIPTNATWSSGGGFTATIGSTDSDGTQSVTSSTPGVCTASGLAVTYVTAGTCTLTAQTAASTNYAAASGSPQAFAIGQATPSAPTITNIPTNAIWSSGGGFTATLGSTDSDGAQSVTSSTPGVCTASGLAVTYVTAGTCTLTAQTAASTDYAAASGSPQAFTIGQATPSGPTITNLPSDATWSPGGGFTATLGNTDSDGTQSVTSSTPGVCTASGLAVTYVTAGTCTLTAQTAASTNYAAASGSPQDFTIGQVTPTAPTITNLPTSPTWSSGGGFTAQLSDNGSDGTQSVTSSTTDVCTASGLAVTYVTAGTCTLTAQTAESTDYAQAIGSPQTFTIAKVVPAAPTITNVPSHATWSSGGGFTAQLSDNGSDGFQVVISSTPGVCTASNLAVTYVAAGTCTLTAQTAESTDYTAVSGSPQTFTVGQATPTTPTITNVPSNATWSSGGGFTAQLSDNGSDGLQLVISSTPGVCTASNLAVTYVAAGTCTLTAQTAMSTDYTAVSGSPQTFVIGKATPTAPTISNLPNSGAYLGGFTASVSTSGDGTKSVTTNAPTVCTVGSDGLTVDYVSVGVCSLTAHVAIGTDYVGADGSAETFTVFPAAASAPSITNLPTGSSYGGSFVPTISTDGDGTKSVTSNSTAVCAVGSDGLIVSFVGVGTCSLTSHVGPGSNLAGADGNPQTFDVARATPSSPVVSGIPGGATEFQSFVGAVVTSGDGTGSITSSTGGVCTVGSDGLTVTFVGFGSCTLTATVGQGSDYAGRTGAPQTFTVSPAARGYWLVGSDGGIFSFGAAGFHGSMGGIPLQRPVVGITPTASRNGYWLVASDGGIFAFGDAAYYGSIPGVGLHPAGSGEPDSLDAPIVGMVPSSTGQGYFMVASDGGVFAFGDAHFAGSCPGIGGCDGTAVAVMPDGTGNGYWLVTNLGAVYSFGDAGNYGEPPAQSSPVVDAVATPDGHGYWVLYANGAVFGFGDAEGMGAPVGYVNSFNPAAAVFPTADGKGYWVAAARGDVFSYGDAPFLGSMAASGLNGDIIAGVGF